MAEIINGKEENTVQIEKEKLESVKKADAAVKSMNDFTSPEELYKELITSVRKYHPSADISMIEKAYAVASEAHKDQKRKSGEPYIIHPLCVAIILADLELDKETIVAGLLHDAVEDTWMTYEEVEKEFGSEVALLVDGVTKLGQLSYAADKVEVQAENLRKMFLAMAKDIRVILIKLADRLHNMRTLQYMRPEKQQEKARETMDIYAPIAMRLGISKIKVELDDLSLKYLKPDVYYDLVEKVALRKSVREEFVGKIVQQVKKHMEDANIKAQVDGRVKHFFSIYKKMVNQDKTIDQIYDLFAVRILVDTVKDCYAALGVIHEMYKPIPGRFKDYIAMPKPNMYQSLHTTLIGPKDTVKDCYAALGVIHEMYKPIPGRFKDYIAMPKPNMYQSLHTTLIGPNGQPFEIQIRTFEMHRTAEYGIAAHWKYKESSDGKVPVKKSEEEKLNWLRQILEWQRDMSEHRTAEYGIAAHWKYKESSDGKVPVKKSEEEKLNWLRQILEWQRDMSDNREAEYGIAAHWKYKESSDGKVPVKKSEEEKLNWLRQILEWQRDMSDNREFMSLLKNDLNLFADNVYCFTPQGDVKNLPTGSTPIDFAYSVHSAVGNFMSLLKNDLNLFADNVYCFTPQGDVKNLPTGSTPIDFAYSVHSAVGNKMVGARVNGKLVPIEYQIKNGDRIEIITSQNSQCLQIMYIVLHLREM